MSAAREKTVVGSSDSHRSSGLRRWAAWGLLAVALVCLFFTLYALVSSSTETPDFAGFYATGMMLRQGKGKRLYDVASQERVERGFLSGARFFPLDHPPFESWLCLPFAFLPYHQAYLAWAAFSLLVLAVVFYFLPCTGCRLDAHSRLIWLAACFPLVGGSLVLGQDSLLLVPVFLFAFLELKKRHDFVAGLLLGLGLFRFEILLPFIFIFLLRRRWNMLAGFVVTSEVALLTSWGLVGWGGLVDYYRILLAVGRTTGSRANGVTTAAMPSLRGAVATFLGGVLPSWGLFSLILAGTLLLLFWAAWQFRHISDPANPSFDLEFSLATLCALLASYHLFVHELTPLILVAFLFLGHEEVTARSQPLLKRPGALLLLLFALVLIVGEMFGFRAFSVVCIVLFGLMVWLSQEISAAGSQNLPAPRRSVSR